MPACCRSGPCEEIFKPRAARRSLEQYRKKGHGDLERRMVAAASKGGIAGARVLEIGGGIGTIQAELLEGGAAQGEVVELVAAWEPYARELARTKGFAERTSFRVADVLEEPERVDPADVVVLNRVVCCSPDGVELTRAAARLTTHRLILSFPRDVFWIRAGVAALNTGLRLLRRSFRVFLHPRSAIVAAAHSEGLELFASGRAGPWEYAALERA